MTHNHGEKFHEAINRVGEKVAEEVEADPENICLICLTKELFMSAIIATAGDDVHPLQLGKFLQAFITELCDELQVPFQAALIMTSINEKENNADNHKLHS